MNRRKIRIILIILNIFLIISMFSNVYAADAVDKSGSQITNLFNASGTVTEGETLIKKIIGPVLSAVRIVATGISVIMLTYLGIKYMSAAPSEKANIKNQLVTFTVGAVVVIGTTSLLEIIKNWAQTATK